MNPADIDLGLDRPRCVARRMLPSPQIDHAVSVAGTNGKGSCVAFLEEICLAAGLSVAAYTSPHLLNFNERVRLGGECATDEALIEAFDRVETARSGVALTAFEFQTLAALQLLHDARPDVALLEVGLGGRLDAVNLVDAEVAVISSIGLDHQAWLGEDRDSIGREKAGIARAGRPVVVGEPEPPPGLVQALKDIGARSRFIGTDFRFEAHAGEGRWHWFGDAQTLENLPLPTLVGAHQLLNASTALAALESMGKLEATGRTAVEQGLVRASPDARFQRIDGEPQIILDVAHNPSAARALADTLGRFPRPGRTLAVLAMFADKDVAGVYSEMSPCVHAWYLAGLEGRRGATANFLSARLPSNEVNLERQSFASVGGALRAARHDAAPGDRIVVFGSFRTVGDALAVLRSD